jgi:hypothetical protein
MNHTTRTTRRRGNAMGEMVLVLPLLFVVLSLLFFLGRGVVRAQRAHVMDRYEAWRQVGGVPQPGHDNALGSPQLNQLFLGNKADTIDYTGSDRLPRDATVAWVTLVYEYDTAAGELAQRQAAHADHGHTATFTTIFAESNAFWQRFESPMTHGHTRIGNDWAHVNGWYVDDSGIWRWRGQYGPNLQTSIRDVFIADLDEQLDAMDSPLADGIRSLYMARPGYAGPELGYDAFVPP